MIPTRSWLGWSALWLAACASAPPSPGPQTAPAASEDPSSTPAEAPKSTGIPTGCAQSKGEKMCLPDQEFVERLCRDAFPNIALAWFRKDTPWTRAYAVKAAGSGVVADEEFIVLKHRTRPDGYEALRWDGTCISLGTEQVTTRKPGNPKAAEIPWRKLAEGAQTALLSDAKVKQLYERRRKECLGATAAGGDTPCDKAEAAFSAAIVSYVRAGGQVPDPTDAP